MSSSPASRRRRNSSPEMPRRLRHALSNSLRPLRGLSSMTFTGLALSRQSRSKARGVIHGFHHQGGSML